MLTYRTGAAGAPSVAKAMAEYLAKEAAAPGLSEKMAEYYGEGLMNDDGVLTAAIPRRDMHASIAGLLGIDPSKPLTTVQVASLLSGQRADGADIQGKKQASSKQVRIGYVDFTISAPKSLSVALELAPTDAERAILDKCHRDAVKETIDVISAAVGTVSRGDTRKNFEREAAHVAVLTFEHRTARPVAKIARTENGIQDTELVDVGAFGDMQRHTHCIMPAVAITDSGRVGSIHQHAIKQRIHEWGSIYQAFLATNLRKHGVEVELDRRPELHFNERMARLVAIPQRISDLFSKRTTDGEAGAREHAAKKGVDYDALPADEKVKLLKSTIAARRKEKETGAEVAAWKAQAQEAGYNHRSVLRPGEERGLAPHSERLQQAYDVSLPLLEQQFANRAVIEGSVPRVAAAKGLIEAGIETAADVNAITAAHRSEGVRQDGETTSVHWAFDPAERFARLTTQLSVDQEEEAIAILRAAAGDKSVALSPEALQRAVEKVEAEGFDFSQGHGLKQREVMDKLAASGRASVAVGIAGSGKSTLLRPLIAAWQEDHRQVYGVTLGWRQTEGLRDAGIGRIRKSRKAFAPVKDTLVEAGIDDQKTFALTPFLMRLETGKLTLNKESVVVIDEIALIGTKQLLRLARLQREQEFQIVGIGDDKQCQAIEAGATIDLCRLAFGADNVPELISTVRQVKERDRETSLMFREGNAKDAVLRKEEDGSIVIVPGGYADAIRATVDLWWSRREAGKDRDKFSLGISVPTNEDGRAIGEEIRKRRRAVGEIGDDICRIDAVDQNGDKYKLALAVGDKVRLFDRVFGKDANNHHGFVGNNGTVLEVVGADKHTLTVKKATGGIAKIEWEDLRSGGDRIRLTRGDAVTIDARQSETLTEHITSMPNGSAAVNGFKAYVAESRQREASWIVTSQGAEKQEIESRRSIGDPRNKDTEPATLRAAILENMGRNLSRQPTKTLATEFLERAVHLKSGAIGAMQAAWFRQETRQAVAQPPVALPVTIIQPAQQAPVEAPVAAPAVTPKPKTEARKAMSPTEVQAAFEQVLRAEGFRLKGPPIMDGQWHRVAVDGDKGAQKSGSYRGGVGGEFRTKFRGGKAERWHPTGGHTALSPEERAAQQAADRAARLQAQADRKEQEIRVARNAAIAWKAAKVANPRHPYLVRKQIDPHGIRQGVAGQTVPMTDGKEMKIGGKLLVPLRDEDGKLWNLQIISNDGSKLFLPGRKKGLSAVIGQISDGTPVIIAEGFATAATLHNTTSLTSVAAIDSGNILSVANSIRSKFPGSAIIIAADDDHHLPLRTPALPNVGLEKAADAAKDVGGVVVAPTFAPDDKGTDWNDVHVGKGRDAARKAIEEAFAKQGISPLLPAYTAAAAPVPKQITQADRDAAWAVAKSKASHGNRSRSSVAKETNRPTNTQGI